MIYDRWVVIARDSPAHRKYLCSGAPIVRGQGSGQTFSLVEDETWTKRTNGSVCGGQKGRRRVRYGGQNEKGTAEEKRERLGEGHGEYT